MASMMMSLRNTQKQTTTTTKDKRPTSHSTTCARKCVLMPESSRAAAVPESLDALCSLELGELKRLCASLGIDVSRFVERSDFWAAILPHSAAAAPVLPATFDANLTRAVAAAARDGGGGAAPAAPLCLCFLDVDGVLNNTEVRAGRSQLGRAAQSDRAALSPL